MKSSTPHVRSWLYTSQLTDKDSFESVTDNEPNFRETNEHHKLSGFLISNGESVMQLLEGPDETMQSFKSKISADPRHRNVDSIIWDMEPHRAYPHWAMKFHEAEDYEILFEEIESAKVETIATQTARMIFDTIFDKD